MVKGQQDRIIIGIDPGTNVMGYGVLKIENGKPVFMDMGVEVMTKIKDPYMKLKRVFDVTTELVEKYLPDEFAIEAQFFGKNVQSMLKLGRAQGVAIAAALERDLPICEYAPLKVKMAITGHGDAAKEQVASMLRRLVNIPEEMMKAKFDATDALAVAYCHYLQASRPTIEGKKFSNWSSYISANPEKVTKRKLK